MAYDNEAVTDLQSRRALLKKLGLAAGTLAWSTPIVQTIATPAASAQGNGNGNGNGGGNDKCIYFRFEYTDSSVDEGTICGTQNVYDTDTLVEGHSISVPHLHISCSDTFTDGFSDGQSDLGGKQVQSWTISKDGGKQTCSGSLGTTTTTSTTTTSTSSTSTSTTTTEAPKGGGASGSPEPGKDISHMDWVVSRGSGQAGSKRYGVQYDFHEGWGPHPSGPIVDQHCLGSSSWRVPPGSFDFSDFGNAVSAGGGAYLITLPADVSVHEAYAKCGQICRAATHVGGNTWRFEPC